MILRILGGHAALQRVAGHADVLLPRHAALRRADLGARGDADLRLHQVDPRDAFGDRVLDLDARIHLDEVELAGIGVLQELDGARRPVAHRAPDLERGLAQLRARRVGEEHRRRPLHDLLVATLQRAVALIEMHEVAVRVAENLHFHVPRADDELLEIHLVFAERGFRLAPRGGHGLGEAALVLDDAHAAPASAPARLQHDRKAHLARQLARTRLVVGQRRRRRHHRHTRALCKIARGDLVAQPAHGVGQGAHENDARRRASFRELRALGQKAVPRMDGVDARLAGDAHDVVDVQVRLDRPLALADEIALVGLGPMQREAVLARVNCHRANAELGGGAHHANGDFAAIRDEQALDRGRLWEWLHLRMMIASGTHAAARGGGSMFGLAIHGGAGTLPRAEMSAESEARYRAGLSAALSAGFAVLESRRLEPRGGRRAPWSRSRTFRCSMRAAAPYSPTTDRTSSTPPSWTARRARPGRCAASLT